MNYLIGLVLFVALVRCEPPVHGYQAGGFGAQNSYLPPRTGYSSPSNSYLPSTGGSSYQGSNNFGGNTGNYDNHGSQGHGHSHENEVPKSYEFGYSVKDAQSGNDYDRRESSDGSVVRGEYRVQLPDGRMQIVTYHADWQTGFHADVRYEGEARYPEPTNRGQGYNYNTPDYSGSLTGFRGSGSGYQHQQPSTGYGPPGYH